MEITFTAKSESLPAEKVLADGYPLVFIIARSIFVESETDFGRDVQNSLIQISLNGGIK